LPLQQRLDVDVVHRRAFGSRTTVVRLYNYFDDGVRNTAGAIGVTGHFSKCRTLNTGDLRSGVGQSGAGRP
jgi:hypothetical protein